MTYDIPAVWGITIPPVIAEYCVKEAIKRDIMPQEIAVDLLVAGMECRRLHKVKQDHIRGGNRGNKGSAARPV